MTAASRRTPPKFGLLTITLAAEPRGDWTREQAIDLISPGYSLNRVVELTGYDRRWLTAQQRHLDHG